MVTYSIDLVIPFGTADLFKWFLGALVVVIALSILRWLDSMPLVP